MKRVKRTSRTVYRQKNRRRRSNRRGYTTGGTRI